MLSVRTLNDYLGLLALARILAKSHFLKVYDWPLHVLRDVLNDDLGFF